MSVVAKRDSGILNEVSGGGRKFIRTAGPSITQREIDYVTDAVSSGWNSDWNNYIVRFERSFAARLGVTHAMTTASGTGALHLALLALGIGPGDEVILPDLSWIATASAVVYTGATPVMCDVQEGSWCMDPVSAEAMITPRTKTLMPVHLYGHPASMPEIAALAKKYNLSVLEDAAPAVGASVAGRLVGSWGDMAAFSFQGAKILVTGEGGMLVTDNGGLFERAHRLGDHGRHPTVPLSSIEVGHKYKMSNLQAAMGTAQLERLDELLERKRWINSRYRMNLSGLNALVVSSELQNCRSAHWMTSIEVLGIGDARRDEVMAEMKVANIDSRPVFRPMSSMPMFETRPDNKVAYRVGTNSINLPSAHDLSADDIDYVSEVVTRICG